MAISEMKIQKTWISVDARLKALINPIKTIVAARPFITK